MMGRLTKVFGLIGGVLVAFMVVGFLLPGTWAAEVSVDLDAAPESVFPLLADLGRWDEWTQWAEIESTLTDPSAGVGAMRRWDDAQYGSGSVTIVESRPFELIRYRVRVGERAEVAGTLRVERSPNGSIVTWREEGDFGRNPLMGYVARTMSDAQAQQLSESLARLEGAVGSDSSPEGPPPAN